MSEIRPWDIVPDAMFDAFKAVKFDPSPLNDDAPKAPVEELNVRLALEEGDILPVACVANKGKQVVSLALFTEVTNEAAPVKSPTNDDAVKIPVTITPVLVVLSFSELLKNN